MPGLIDLVGKRFGRLTAHSLLGKMGGSEHHWRCVCDCGTEKVVIGSLLRRGMTKSCGCLQLESNLTVKRNLTHGMAHSPTYHTWECMIQRCGNEENPKFVNYGERGIRVCERWHAFENFLADMGRRPIGKTLDRNDNDGNYEPGNCRWATPKQQARNRRSSRTIAAFGDTKTLVEWSEDSRCSVNVNGNLIRVRLGLGWNPEKAIAMPARSHAKRKK